MRRQPQERDSPRARQHERAPLALAQACGGAPWLGANAGSLPSVSTSATPALGGSSTRLRSPRTLASLGRQSAQGQRLPLMTAPPSSAFLAQQQQQNCQDENADSNNKGGSAAAAAAAQQQQGSGSSRLLATPVVGVASASGCSPAVTVNPLRQLQFTARRVDAAATGLHSRRTKQQTIAAFLQSPPLPASTDTCHGGGGAGPSRAAPAAGMEAGPSTAAGGGSASKRGGNDVTPHAMAGSALPLQKRLRISFERGVAGQPSLQQAESGLGQQQQQQQEQALPLSGEANLLEPSPEHVLSGKLVSAACGGGSGTVASPKASPLLRQGSADENACGNT